MLCWRAVGRPSGGSIIWCACFAHGDWMREHRKEITFSDINFVRALSSDMCRTLDGFGKPEFWVELRVTCGYKTRNTVTWSSEDNPQPTRKCAYLANAQLEIHLFAYSPETLVALKIGEEAQLMQKASLIQLHFPPVDKQHADTERLSSARGRATMSPRSSARRGVQLDAIAGPRFCFYCMPGSVANARTRYSHVACLAVSDAVENFPPRRHD
jgi:hypothetical protein